MRTISDIVEEIYLRDFEAQSASRNHYLDVPAYARKIKKEVSNIMYKEVGVRTLAVTIARIISKHHKTVFSEMKPKLSNVYVHNDLVEYTFERTRSNLDKIVEYIKEIEVDPDKFFTITQNNHELTIISNKEIAKRIKTIFAPAKPIFTANNLSGVTVKFPISYLDQPNIVFEITRRLANRNINLIEIVSTTTELTFIVSREDSGIVVMEMTGLM